MKYLNVAGWNGREEIIYKVVLTRDQLHDIERFLEEDESIGGFIVAAALDRMRVRRQAAEEREKAEKGNSAR